MTTDDQNQPADETEIEAVESVLLPNTGFVDDAIAESSLTDEDIAYIPPTDEELSAAAPQMQGLIPLINLSRDEIQKLYESRVAQIGPEKFLSQVAVSGSFENLIWFTLQNFSAEAERTQTAVTQIIDKDLFNYKLERDGKTILSNTGFKAQHPNETKMVSGEAGMVAMLSTKRGQIRRIPLYNSGFSIDIRSAHNDDLSVLLRRCRAELDEYGREFGSHFYAYSDLIIKRSFFDSILQLTIGASLKDWKKPGVLMQRLKLSDYDVILTNVASLMWPEGYPYFRIACTRPADQDYPTGCDHVTEINANLTQLIYTNFAALNEQAVAHMVKARMAVEPITPKALAEYQQHLGFDGETVVFDNFEFTLQVPSMADYFQAGEQFNTDLLNEISADNRKGIYSAIVFREARIYLPWIKQMASIDEANRRGNVTEDKAVIAFILDTITSNDKDRVLIKQFTDFVNRSKLSNICYKAFPCEKCNYQPVTSSGFMTMDPQHSFFIQSTQKLMRS